MEETGISINPYSETRARRLRTHERARVTGVTVCPIDVVEAARSVLVIGAT